MKALFKYCWQLYRLWLTEKDEYYYDQLRNTIHLSQFHNQSAAYQLADYFGVYI